MLIKAMEVFMRKKKTSYLKKVDVFMPADICEKLDKLSALGLNKSAIIRTALDVYLKNNLEKDLLELAKDVKNG